MPIFIQIEELLNFVTKVGPNRWDQTYSVLGNKCWKIFKVCLTILRHCEVKGYYLSYILLGVASLFYFIGGVVNELVLLLLLTSRCNNKEVGSLIWFCCSANKQLIREHTKTWDTPKRVETTQNHPNHPHCLRNHPKLSTIFQNSAETTFYDIAK